MSKRLVATAVFLVLGGCAVPPPPPVVVAAPAGPSVGERLAADQQRINEGMRLGQFTPREFEELQGRHNAIEGTRREQLAAGGGQFAPGQYQQLLAREEALSRTIYEYRHNGATPTAH